jgi:DNA mismatch endonuclease, patch repair protein
MVDVHTKKQRSRNMAAIKAKNTKPELAVRSLLHRMGYRFRVHRNDLPGKPDIVFVSKRKLIFVHGCFWHMHRCRFGAVTPATNAAFWHEKRTSNVRRDSANRATLRKSGWKVLTVWACSIQDETKLKKLVKTFLGRKQSRPLNHVKS